MFYKGNFKQIDQSTRRILKISAWHEHRATNKNVLLQNGERF